MEFDYIIKISAVIRSSQAAQPELSAPPFMIREDCCADCILKAIFYLNVDLTELWFKKGTPVLQSLFVYLEGSV